MCNVTSYTFKIVVEKLNTRLQRDVLRGKICIPGITIDALQFNASVMVRLKPVSMY